MKMTVIPARPQAVRHVEAEKKIRVAAYCRVSTEYEEQESSYEIQCAHYKRLIEEKEGWELAGIYADEGITGTNVKHRKQFLQMIEDCKAGKIDLVITKSISRFARNTLDCLNYIRQLKAMRIPILFEKESINTLDSKGELLITIMASIAQQESASISSNVKLGIQYRYQQGKICAGVQHLLGYQRTEEGSLTLLPKDAVIVRKIFRLFLDGYKTSQIEKIMVKWDPIDSRGMRRTWNGSSLKYILTNEKYQGDVLLQKSFSVDFLTKKKVKNEGQVPQYYVENSHEPIVPRAIFEAVQAEFARRHAKKENWFRMPFTRKVFCGLCGEQYYRFKNEKGAAYWKRGTGRRENLHEKECENPGILEEQLKVCVAKAFNQLPEDYEDMIRTQTRLHYAELPEIERKLKEDPSLADERMDLFMRDIHLQNLIRRTKAVMMKEDWVEDTDGACSDPDRFMEITGQSYPRGKMFKIRTDDLILFVERIEIYEGKIIVKFVGGVSQEVAWEKMNYCAAKKAGLFRKEV